MTPEEYRAYVEQVAAEAPRVTEAQRAQLAPLLRIGIEQLQREAETERRAA